MENSAKSYDSTKIIDDIIAQIRATEQKTGKKKKGEKMAKGKKTTTVLVDEDGHKIPVKYIDPIEVERHELVEEIIQHVKEAEILLMSLKQIFYYEISNYLDKVADNYGENWKGNASLMNFNKTMGVDLQINKVLAFDERLNVAKQKIDDCLNRWSVNAKAELKTLVMKAFNVDKKGNVDTKQILALRKFKFEDPTWCEAMEIIDQAVTTIGSKEYINFKVRDSSRDPWRRISLNFATMEVSK